jgi:hypothetical protein
MPSIEMELALVVFQLNCTWSPAEITVGVALNCAVGAPVLVAGASSADGKGAVFFLQPETAVTATSKRAIINFCVFKGILLLKKGQVALSGNRVFLSPQRAAFRFQHP